MKTVEGMVKHYKEMESYSTHATNSMIREVKEQYIDMAKGGDGGQLLGFDEGKTCRSYNYPGYPDSFFQSVCDAMGWK